MPARRLTAAARPPLAGVLMALLLLLPHPAGAQKKSGSEPLFGKAYSRYTIVSSELKGAEFYLVSGHGGPDPGCIGKYKGKELHEDEYAYDIILRLGRELLKRGAKVHFIIQDARDGIRDGEILQGSKRETCMGQAIPLNQTERLKQRSAAINRLAARSKSAYKRSVFIHIDSRSKGEQTDVYFYHAPGSAGGERLARRLQSTFRAKYRQNQPGRGFTGTVSARGLYVLRSTNPVGVFLELGNIQNARDQKRLVVANNRQALANWITQGIIADYKNRK